MIFLIFEQTGLLTLWYFETLDNIKAAVWGSFDSLITSISSRLPFLLAAVIVFALFWLIAKIARWIFMSATRRGTIDVRFRLLVGRLIVALTYLVGVFTALTVIIPSFSLGSLIAGLGFTSFVIGFAAKDIVNNFLSGVLILWQQPFHIGDYLFVGSDQGIVENIGVRATSLRKDDGELILIPNGDMYSSALTIRGAGSHRRMTLKFAVDFDTDIERAREAILHSIEGAKEIVAEPAPGVLATEITIDGIGFTVSFWINTGESQPLSVQDHVLTDITKALRAGGVKLFPRLSAVQRGSWPPINT